MNLKSLILGAAMDLCRTGTASTKNILTGTSATTSASAAVVGVGSSYLTEVIAGDSITIGAITGTVLSIASNTALTLSAAAGSTVAATTAYVTTVAREVTRPDIVTAANWTKISDIEDCTVNLAVEREDVFAPNPGAYQRKKSLVKSTKLTVEMTANDLSVIIDEMQFGAGAAIADTGTGTLTPLTGSGEIEGWWRFRQYDSGNTLRRTLVLWGRATLGSTQYGNSVAKPKISLDVFRNSVGYGLIDYATA